MLAHFSFIILIGKFCTLTHTLSFTRNPYLGAARNPIHFLRASLVYRKMSNCVNEGFPKKIELLHLKGLT